MTKSLDKEKQSKPNDSVAIPPCDGSIPIIPVRYAIMPKKEIGEGEDYAYQDSSAKLESNFEPLESAYYTLRTLRAGYIYLYDDTRKSLYLWEHDGIGNYTALFYAGREDYRKSSNRKAKTTNITVCDKTKKVFLLYSQNLLTYTTLAKIELDLKYRKSSMVELNIGEILDGSGNASTQKHVLPTKKIDDWESLVEEYKTELKDYDKQFSWSSFPTDKSVIKPATIQAKEIKYAKMHQPKLPIVVALYDNLAIAYDIGRIANLYQHQIIDIKNKLNTSDEKKEVKENKLPTVTQLDTSKIVPDTKDFYRKKACAEMIEKVLESSYPYSNKEKDISEDIEIAKQTLKYNKSHTGRYVGESEAKHYVLSNSSVNKQAKSFVKHINKPELAGFHKKWDLAMMSLKKRKEKAQLSKNDHATLLKTAEKNQCSDIKSIASVLQLFDHNSIGSSREYELAVASVLDGAGMPLPEQADTCLALKKIGEWMKDNESPLIIGLNSFNPFKAKADTVGDIISELGTLSKEMHKLYPATLSTTIITQNLVTQTFRNMNPNSGVRSAVILDNINETLRATGAAPRLFISLVGRYELAGDNFSTHEVTKKWGVFIEGRTPMPTLSTPAAQVKVTNPAPHSTQITATNHTISRTAAVSTEMVRAVAGSGFSAGAFYFHCINTSGSLDSLSKEQSLETVSTMISAVFGMTAASVEGMQAARLVYLKGVEREFVGVGLKKVLKEFLFHGGASRWAGGLGAVAEAFANWVKAGNRAISGDHDAAAWYVVAGFGLGVGGLISTFGLFSLGPIGVALWALGFFVVGIIAAWRAVVAEDTPLEIWASRSIFGIERTPGKRYKTALEETEEFIATIDEIQKKATEEVIKKLIEKEKMDQFSKENPFFQAPVKPEFI